MKITATVKEIKFRNDSNGWTVISCIDSDQKPFNAVGVMPTVNTGEQVEFDGSWVEHINYGTQFKVSSYINILPKGKQAMLAYLSSGFVRGLREATAKLIVDTFGDDTFDIIRDNPEKLTAISGIGRKRAKLIHDSYLEKYHMQDIVIGLQQLGLSVAMSMKLYKLYGQDCVQHVRDNPYQLIDDVENIGFKTADNIAREAGYEYESEFRISAGIKYTLSLAKHEGNTCLPREILVNAAAERILGVNSELVESVLESMIVNSKLREQLIDGVSHVFLPGIHFKESECAILLNSIKLAVELLPSFNLDDAIVGLEKRKGIKLAPLQNEAVRMSCTDGLLVITGGPGTGKTTILSFIIDIMDDLGLSLELAAPTGRAAKRMSDATGREARTLHRLLEYNFGNNEFNRNADYPLETDVIIVDEMSMIDVPLFNALLRATAEGTRLIMVGDVDQLPSVGPGNVLHDIVSADYIPVIKLDRIYRQEGRSMIVTNAHRINHGETPVLDSQESDFKFYECGNTDIALRSVLDLCYDKIKIEQCSDVQVLAPMKNDKLGVYNLNRRLQELLNPSDPSKGEVQFGEILFREGDRVMQIKNNYDIGWKRKIYGRKEEEGEGIFNGDIGTILSVDATVKNVTIIFDDERVAVYSYNGLEEVELAYCISIHKSQGSEFSCVVLPLMNGPVMLMTRNILYTAVTRARSNVYILGSSRCLENMVRNTREKRRYSALAFFLKELNKGISI